jgi:pimeloyl-ACP methyl ester carboxylesterase
LQDEVDLIAPALAAAGSAFSIIGHSYGAAVALIAALHHRSRVSALALYEPTLFALVDARRPPPNAADGIRNAVSAAASALERGDQDAAAGHFIDFWMGNGSWAAIPAQRRLAIAQSVSSIRHWEHALFRESTPIEAFACLDMPILYMLGGESPESAHAVARELVPVLPRVKVVRFAGLGHMAPITHPDIVNAEIARFLGEV